MQSAPRSNRDDFTDVEPLNGEAARAYRGVTARVNYLAQDRLRIQLACAFISQLWR